MPIFSNTVQSIVNFIESINEWIGKLVSWLTLVMVIITTLIVLLRYVFDIGWVAMQESVLFMHSLVFMLGAAYTFKQDGHVRVDIFYQRFNVKTKAWIDLLGTLLLLLPVSGLIIWSSWDYILNSWEIQEGSRNSGGLPGVYLLKSCILMMAILLVLQGVATLLKSLLTILGVSQVEEIQHG
jgi:TRAP-type mannitol/chloroaromatic compound transport system permease small subunit